MEQRIAPRLAALGGEHWRLRVVQIQETAHFPIHGEAHHREVDEGNAVVDAVRA